MWNVKAKATPVIRGATGRISKSLRHYQSNITGKHEIKELQKKQPYRTTHTTEIAVVNAQNISRAK